MTFLLLAISETGIEAFDQTSPTMYLTLSWSMTLFAALTAGSGVHWLSSTTAVIFLFKTPPLAFHSSMARSAPSRVMTPKVGTGPDRGAKIATLMFSGSLAQAVNMSRTERASSVVTLIARIETSPPAIVFWTTTRQQN